MKRIRIYLVKNCKLLKSKSAIPYIDELTVFIKVRIESLKDFSKSIPLKLNKHVRIKKDNIKIRIVKKYLLIS